MNSIRNKISTKELMDAILKITNSVILYDRKPLEKDICKHNTLTYTRATILHEPLIIEFYYSILIFCYEYELKDLAKAIFGNETYLPTEIFLYF